MHSTKPMYTSVVRFACLCRYIVDMHVTLKCIIKMYINKLVLSVCTQKICYNCCYHVIYEGSKCVSRLKVEYYIHLCFI